MVLKWQICSGQFWALPNLLCTSMDLLFCKGKFITVWKELSIKPLQWPSFTTQGKLSCFHYLMTATVTTVWAPLSPGMESIWKPGTNLFLRSVHLLLSDKLLLFCCEPCSKQGQEPLVSLALSLPKELCACRKGTHVSRAPGRHSAQQHKLKQHWDRGKLFVKINNLFSLAPSTYYCYLFN